MPSLIPFQAKAESGLTKQTNVVLTDEKLAQLVYDRDMGVDPCAHSVMGLISRSDKKRKLSNFYTCLPCVGREELLFLQKKGKLIKKYSVAKLEKVQGIWTEIEVVMTDLEREHRTLIKVKDIKYNSNLPDDTFTRRNLETW